MGYKIGDTVTVIKDDGWTEESFVGKIGTIVSFHELDVKYGDIGIDFGTEISFHTHTLHDTLPENTGRYYHQEHIKPYKPYAVELI